MSNLYLDTEAVEDWFINKRPRQFPTVLFKVLGKMDREREIWLKANPGRPCEVIAEGWLSPQLNQCRL